MPNRAIITREGDDLQGGGTSIGDVATYLHKRRCPKNCRNCVAVAPCYAATILGVRLFDGPFGYIGGSILLLRSDCEHDSLPLYPPYDLPMSTETMSVEEEARVVEQIREGREKIAAELSKVIVGQHEVIEQLLICLFAGGHCLITGAPGLAKTLLVRSVSHRSST